MYMYALKDMSMPYTSAHAKLLGEIDSEECNSEREIKEVSLF